jgi:hypothetical protein
MKLFCLLSLCGLLFATPAQPTESDIQASDCICHNDDAVMMAPFAITWSAKAAATSCAVSRTCGVWGSDGLYHMICGNCQTHTSHPNDETWDPLTDIWTTGLARPTAGIHNLSAVAYGHKIWVGGGSNASSGYDDNFTCINLDANTWTTIGAMPVASLLYYEMAAGSGKVFVFGGGITGTNITNQAWAYDTAAGTWAALANMPAAMRDVSCGVVGDTVYIGGGCTTYSTGLNTLWKYSISGNTYTAGPNMPGALFWAVGVVAPHADSGLQFLVMGGQNGTSYLSTVYRYNPRGHYWVTETAFPTGRRSHAGAASPEGYLYISCGYNGSFLSDLQEGVPSWLPPAVEEQEGDLALSKVVVAPNPVKDRTAVSYQLSSPAAVNMALYDVCGKLVKNLASGEKPAGSHRVDLDLRSLAAGVYVVRLNYGAQTAITKLVVTE